MILNQNDRFRFPGMEFKMNISTITKWLFIFFSLSLAQKLSAQTTFTSDSNPVCNTPNNAASEPTPMEYVDICNRNGECKKFSRLVMGTDHLVQGNWNGDGKPDLTEEQAYEVLDEAAKYGINFYDTSPIYVGGVEYKLGRWRKSRHQMIQSDAFYKTPQLNPDRQLYALSKGGFPFDLFWSKQLAAGPNSNELKEQLEQFGILSSKNLATNGGATALGEVPAGTYESRLFGNTQLITSRVSEELGHSVNNLDDITIYLMHRDDGDAVKFQAVDRLQTPVETIMEALADKNISQKFWMQGWSNWKTERVNESLRLAETNKNLNQPVINSPYFSLFEMSDRTIHALGVQVKHQEMMDPEFQKGIKIMPYSPLGGFSILDQPEPKWMNAKKAATKKFNDKDAYWQNVLLSIFTDANEARWNRVVEFTKQFNQKNCTSYTVDQMMNAYVLAHPRVNLLAVGPITKAQIQRTVASVRLSKMLTPQDLDYLYYGNK